MLSYEKFKKQIKKKRNSLNRAAKIQKTLKGRGREILKKQSPGSDFIKGMNAKI